MGGVTALKLRIRQGGSQEAQLKWVQKRVGKQVVVLLLAGRDMAVLQLSGTGSYPQNKACQVFFCVFQPCFSG